MSDICGFIEDTAMSEREASGATGPAKATVDSTSDSMFILF